jgi:hypothetical protein
MQPSSWRGSRWPGSEGLALAAVLGVAALLLGALSGWRSVSLDPGDAWGWEGFYPVEVERGGARFRWSRPRALIHFRGVDRSKGVRLELELAAWRPQGAPDAELRIEVDRQVIWSRPARAEWQTLPLGTGPSGKGHLDVVLDITPFQPAEWHRGSSDRRALGVAVRRARLVTDESAARWAAISLAVALAAWLLLGFLGAEPAIRMSASLACALGGLWAGLSWQRPYALDTLPSWAVPGMRFLLLALVIVPVLLARRWSSRARLSGSIGFLALAASILAVQSKALGNGLFWDDFDFARPIGWAEWLFTFYGSWNWTGIGSDFYRPLVVGLFQIDYRLYGYQAAGYHLTNLLLHLCNAGLVMRLLSPWAGRRWAFAGAVFFALHPLTATGMAWISQRTDVLCASFYLLALLAARRYLKRPRGSALAGSVAGYGGALLAKEMAISFPAVVLWLSGVARRLHRSARLLLPLVGVSGIYLAAWLLLFPYKLAQGNLIAHLLQVPFEYHLRSIFRLLALAFLPVYYPSHDTTYLDEESTFYLLGGSALFLGAGALVFKWGRRAERLLFLFGAGFLLLSVVPLYNFRHPDFIRLGYIPALGATLAAAGLLAFVSRAPQGPFWLRRFSWRVSGEACRWFRKSSPTGVRAAGSWRS